MHISPKTNESLPTLNIFICTILLAFFPITEIYWNQMRHNSSKYIMPYWENNYYSADFKLSVVSKIQNDVANYQNIVWKCFGDGGHLSYFLYNLFIVVWRKKDLASPINLCYCYMHYSASHFQPQTRQLYCQSIQYINLLQQLQVETNLIFLWRGLRQVFLQSMHRIFFFNGLAELIFLKVKEWPKIVRQYKGGGAKHKFQGNF